ncbi:glycoside hydrolase family 3 N-terminal domain-containing protein [Deinococcus malanensis]|uniref:glycoside hydrolase family 3 N-terminal domain-containing protein n=1 Tax=Deinococcus malanensis TaxID=1706855 RepID=UPI00363027CE
MTQPHPLNEEGRALVERLLRDMTLSEKAGQMTQPEKNSVKQGDVTRLSLGSVLSGGGGNPDPNTPTPGGRWSAPTSTKPAPPDWASPAVRRGRCARPQQRCRHDHLPHNIALGATRDADLVRRIGRATALEVAATNVRWNFAPAVSMPHDLRWGRTYEGYGQDPQLVSELASAYVQGLRGAAWNDPTAVLPSVKHFIADGHTSWGSSTRVDRNALDVDRTLAIAQMGEGSWSCSIRARGSSIRGTAASTRQRCGPCTSRRTGRPLRRAR